MASGPQKPKDTAEKAYADAAAQAGSAKAAAPAKPAPAKKKPVAVRKAPKPVAKPAPEVPAPVATAPEPVAAVLEAVTPAAPAPEPEAAVVEASASPEAPAPIEITPPQPTIAELKEKIMATTAKTTDYTKPVSDAVAEIQTRAKAAYEKGTETLSEATEFAKGNVEALVESGKIYAAGVQDLGKSYVEEAKSAYETLTADLKEIAAIKSPTELFQLQGKIARRNFDALVATTSKNTEAVMKLANDTFAPISGRVNLAAEKLAKVA